MNETPSDFQICAVALRKMVTKGYYCCSDVQACFKLMGRPMPHNVERYRILHCVNWSDMPAGFPERMLRDIVNHLYAGTPAIDLINNLAVNDPELAAARGILLNKDDGPFWDRSAKMEDLLKRIDEKIDELVRLELHFQAKRKNWLFRLLGI